ncbi:MAG TPA: alkaline phosphatase family protein [Solirubrobacteraceae bacterium]|nr:alkaline phosphatase family protein [Solirubrobacteraceae bacterium]
MIPRELRIFRRLTMLAGLALLALALAAACGTSSTLHGPVQTTVSPTAALTGRPPAHIAVIVMENEEYGDIIGSHQTPFINSLARHYGLAQRMYATSHPSLPNYLALTGGSTFGISTDCSDCSVHATSLADQISAAHLSWTAYMEGLPHPCYGGAGAGEYAKKHDPFMYYLPLATDHARCDHVVPLTRLAGAERAHTLPRFTWITPNLCHDMHDCSPATGDAFLARLVPPLLSALGKHGLLFVTWDEGTTNDGCCRPASGGHIATIVAGSGARAHARMKTPSDQYSILQTVEDLLGLKRLRGAACACTPSLAPLLSIGGRGHPAAVAGSG